MRKFRFLLAFLLLVASGAWAQTRQLSGNIKDTKSGSSLPSATVKVKGRNFSTVTNSSGVFSLTVPTGNVTLEISMIGYGTRTVTVNPDETTVAIQLDQSSAQLSEVVVTALGITKDTRQLGYSITTVGGGELDKARESNVALSLAGQVAGLDVHGTNGGPAGSARILLRGMPSINSGGSPLFIINGVPMDNTQRGASSEWGGTDNGDGVGNINPDDIATMTVLKGQAASALYGARASNGVIMITTKKGKQGAPEISFNTNYVLDKPFNSTNFQDQYGQGLEGAAPTTANGALNTNRFAWGANLDGSSVIGWDGNMHPYSAYKDNFKDFYRTGPSFTNTIAVSGGGDRGTYRLSASNLNSDAVVRNSGTIRKTFNFNMEQKLSDKLTFTLMANYLDQQDHNKNSLSDGPMNPNNGVFLAPNVNENLFKPGYNPTTFQEVQLSDDPYVTNPWFVVNKNNTLLSRKRFITSISAKYNFTDWLYAMVRLGYDLSTDRQSNNTPTGTLYSYSGVYSGSYGLNTDQITEENIEGLIGASHHITKDLSFNATVGANDRKNDYESMGIGGGPLIIPNLYSYNNVVSFNRSYSITQKEVHSAYYTVDLNYKDFLLLNTTGRYDAYSTLPTSNNAIFTPSVSGGFVFSHFLPASVLNYGKLRAAYAQTSGEPGSPYGTSLYYNVGNSFNGTSIGSINTGLPNLFLKPFVLDELELGAELKFFNSRLGLDVAYFDRTTHKEIQNASLSMATGYSSTVVGTGSTQNKGLEVLLTGTPIQGRDFTWDVSLNLTSVKNKILQTDATGGNLGLGQDRPLTASLAFVKGLSGPQIEAHDYVYNKGNIVVNGSGVPEQGGLINSGSTLPTFYGGLKNNFTYKNWNLSFLIDFNYGNKILSATAYYSILRGENKLTLPGRVGGITTGVTAAGTPNTVTATADDYYTGLAAVSKLDVLNGDFIKLRQITFGYNITEKMLGNIPVFRSITISAVARNLLYFMKKADNIDPESEFSPNVSYSGIEGTSLPSARTFGLNANFKFKN